MTNVEIKLTGKERDVWLEKKGKLEEEKQRIAKEKEEKRKKRDKGAKLTKEEYLKQALLEKCVNFI